MHMINRSLQFCVGLCPTARTLPSVKVNDFLLKFFWYCDTHQYQRFKKLACRFHQNKGAFNYTSGNSTEVFMQR
jgi:hypothetical protein